MISAAKDGWFGARDLARDNGGLAAIEFAFLLPVMLVAYIGSVEIGDGVAIDRKVGITSRTVADLATRYTQISNADMASILGASSAIIAPYKSANLVVTVSQITIDSNGKSTIDWSDSLNGTAHAAGSAVTVPSALVTNGTSLIWGEVKYAYTPTLGYVMTGTLNLSGQIYMRPRSSSSVSRASS